MRNIKYRQFVNGEFHCWGYINHSENGKPEFTGPIKPLDGSFVSSDQFTGLTDKNGKDVYESDIVRLNDCFVAEVKFYGCGFSVLTKSIYANKQYDLTPINAFESIEVIGNIHQHPELLK